MKLLLLFACLTVAVAERKRYDGYELLEVTPVSHAQIRFLNALMTQHQEYDFWLEPTTKHRPVHVFVSPQHLTAFKTEVTKHSLPVTVVNANVQQGLDEQWARMHNKKKAYDYNDFNTYEDFMTEIDVIRDKCPADVTCTTEEIGQSTEGRAIKKLTIDTGADSDFWVDSCIHAREWLACATTMRIFSYMVADEDSEAGRILREFNWHYVPIFNPDGYSFTFSDERFWRKNRAQNAGSTCIGVDLNRNHDFLWATLGSSDNPCSDTFHGPTAASEPEVQAVQDASRDVSNLLVWLSFHTYGQYWLVPYGNCSAHHENEAVVQQVADVTCAAIEGSQGTFWDCGNSCEELYATGGTTADWAMGVGNAKYAYTPELRGSTGGFAPPPSEIEPSFQEIWAGLVAKVDEVKSIEGRK